MVSQTHSQTSQAVIGPNALIQTHRALLRLFPAHVVQTLHYAGLAHLPDQPPEHMVAEQDVILLMQSVKRHLGEEDAARVMALSGEYTAIYLLANRIPGFFQNLLGLLPSRLALRLLLAAVGMHAWTFVGSGRFTYQLGRPSRLYITSHLKTLGVASRFYLGTFETLVHSLIDPNARLTVAIDSSTHCTITIQFD